MMLKIFFAPFACRYFIFSSPAVSISDTLFRLSKQCDLWESCAAAMKLTAWKAHKESSYYTMQPIRMQLDPAMGGQPLFQKRAPCVCLAEKNSQSAKRTSQPTDCFPSCIAVILIRLLTVMCFPHTFTKAKIREHSGKGRILRRTGKDPKRNGAAPLRHMTDAHLLKGFSVKRTL